MTIVATLAMVAFTAHAADAKVDLEKAKENFEKIGCAGCHGKDGKGQTKIGIKLECKDYTTAEVQKAVKDEAIFKAIKEGFKKGEKTVMHPYADKLTDDEIKSLVAYVRKFGPEKK